MHLASGAFILIAANERRVGPSPEDTVACD